MENYDKLLPVTEAPFLEGAELDWYNPKKSPFVIYGLHNIDSTPYFKRLPLDVAAATSNCVNGLRPHSLCDELHMLRRRPQIRCFYSALQCPELHRRRFRCV